MDTNNFDPTKFGATPVNSPNTNSTFDPTKYGAIPITNTQLPQHHVDALQKATDILTSIFPGKQVGEAIGTLGGYVASGFNKNYDTSAPSPLQVAGDIAKGAALVGGFKAPVPTTVLGNIGLGAGLGAAAAGGDAATKTSGKFVPTSKDFLDVAKSAGEGGLIGGVTAGATSLLGHLIAKAGDKIQLTSIKPSAADMKDGFSLQTIKDNNLGGSLSQVYQKTQDKMETLTEQLNQKLAGSNNTINLNDTFTNTANSITGNKAKSFGSNNSIGNALNWLKSEILSVSEDGNVTIPEAQMIKQATGKYGAWQYGATDPEATARQTVANAFYSQLKTNIEKNSPEGVKEINQQLSKLIPVSNAVIRRIPVAERNSALSLTDMITATASVFNPHALLGLGISLAQKEGSVGNLLSKAGVSVSKLAPPVASLSGATVGAFSPAPQATQP